MTTKTCPGFGDAEQHTLPVTEFGRNASRPDGLSAYCKRCAAASQKAWREAHPDTVRANKKKYRDRERAAQQA